MGMLFFGLTFRQNLNIDSW